MSILRKLELFIGLVLLVTVVVLSAQVWIARKSAAIEKEQVHVTTADLGAAEVHAQEMKIYYKQREIKNAQVNATIEANRDWAATELPSDVADQLRHSSGSTRAVP